MENNKFSLTDVLNLYTIDDINAFQRLNGILSFEGSRLKFSDIKRDWAMFGGNESNNSVIGILANGDNGIIERVTNAIDAVIEYEKEKHKIGSAKTPDAVVSKAFPNYYAMKKKLAETDESKLNFKDAGNRVMIVANDGISTTRPTFDIIDTGIGIAGDDFEDTILSLNHGNKISADKGYLIGAFGQGGSTSMSFSNATIIISKKDNKYFFTIVRLCHSIEIKNDFYVYLADDQKILELEDDSVLETFCPEIQEFLKSPSGTIVRMVDTSISKQFRDNEITKPGMLIDFVNTQLFNVGIPVKISDNRLDYKSNSSKQNRYSYGSYLKLKTSDHVYLNGSTTIEHKNRDFKIDYYVLLPIEKEKWGVVSERKAVFNQFNVTLDPIIYTVNGQTISSERYQKLANRGLSFLNYSLLVIIDLDSLGSEKYQFITTDRARLKDYDLTQGFIDKVVQKICDVQDLKDINDVIAQLSVDADVDKGLIDDIAADVKKDYLKFAVPKDHIPVHQVNPNPPGPTPDPEYFDEIKCLDITTTKNKYYKDEVVSIMVKTLARKHVNNDEIIDVFVDGKYASNIDKNSFNGRIQFSFLAKDHNPGMHNIQFAYQKDLLNPMESEVFVFEILDENTPEKDPKKAFSGLNLKIQMLNDAEVICEINKNESEEEKSIVVKMFMQHELLKNEIYGRYASLDETKKLQKELIKPIALFALFAGENYDDRTIEEKNKLIISLAKSLIRSKTTKVEY